MNILNTTLWPETWKMNKQKAELIIWTYRRTEYTEFMEAITIKYRCLVEAVDKKSW